MRMIHYFATLAGLASVLLVAAAWAGFAGAQNHLYLGLSGAITAGAAHSLLILFSIIAGRVLREAVRARDMDAGLLAESNEFFARKAAYPAALIAVLLTAAAAVLGFANRGFGLDPTVHMLAGVVALVVNLWAFGVEARALLENQGVLDRAAAQLDALDRAGAAEERAEDTMPPEPTNWRKVGWTVLIGAWLPYLYQTLIVWRGDFGRVSIHPWIEASALGLVILVLAIREGGRDEAPAAPPE